jgi:hypothetical protein
MPRDLRLPSETEFSSAQKLLSYSGTSVTLGALKEQGKWLSGPRRAGPGVRAAASPGAGGQRREAFSSAEEQVGDPIAKIKTLG